MLKKFVLGESEGDFGQELKISQEKSHVDVNSFTFWDYL